MGFIFSLRVMYAIRNEICLCRTSDFVLLRLSQSKFVNKLMLMIVLGLAETIEVESTICELFDCSSQVEYNHQLEHSVQNTMSPPETCSLLDGGVSGPQSPS